MGMIVFFIVDCLFFDYAKHGFKHLCSALCPEDVLANCIYGIGRFVVFIQIYQKVCLDENLVIPVLAHMVGVMVADQPTDAFNLSVGVTSETYE